MSTHALSIYSNLRSLVGKLDISPPERLKNLLQRMKDKKKRREIGPCGNFSAQYRCLCDLHIQPYLEEVAWVSETISFTKTTCLVANKY